MTRLDDPLLGVELDGRYRVDAPVARGGMAMVYRGTDLRLGRVVALKIMHRHLIDDDGFVERFQREARAAAGLFHPNLVAVHDTGRDGAAVYLVMEYLPNVTLRRELRHRGHLSPRQALVVLDAVLAGLEAVHAAGMIHRDLKPDNVLLGEDGKIKLADFGLARAVSSATTTKTLMGTVGYVAPELVTRAGADARTDLYTVGIMLYEVLTGEQPYTDDVPIRVAYRHVHDDVPPPSDAVPGLSPLLDALVLWATARDPEQRPQSATALREALVEARTELSAAELDLGDTGDPSALTETRPMLVPTAAILTAGSDSGEVPTGTDEIPYLDESDDEESEREGTEGEESGGAVSTLSSQRTGDPGSSDGSADAESAADAGAPAGGEERSGAAASSGTVAAAAATDAAKSSGASEETARPARRRGGLVAWVLVAAVLVVGLVVAGAVYLNQEDLATVPTVRSGQDAEEAISLIEEAGLVATTDEVFSTTMPAGMVVRAEPSGGTELQPGSQVTLTLSKGEELFSVPDVTGSTEADARTTLESSGMVLGKITREHSDSVAEGSVISQGVDSEEEVSRGTAVDLVLSEGVEPIEVPIVEGLTYEAAYGRLAREGFRIARDDIPDDSVESGRVVSQYPRGGTEAFDDDLIILRVSTGPDSEGSDSDDD